MAVIFNERTKTFTLETANSAYQFQVGRFGVLQHLHYGKKLCGGEADYLIRHMARGFSGSPNEMGLMDRSYSYDNLPQEFPVMGIGDYRLPCLEVLNPDGSNAVDLRYQSHAITKGKPKLEGLPATWGDEAETLAVTLRDSVSGVEVELLYSVFAQYDVITRSCVVKNGGTADIVLNRILSACLEFPADNYDFISLYGRHGGERNVERTPVRHGITSVGSTRGTSSHQHNPFVILCEPSAGEEQGECYGMSFVYSGNFVAAAEVDQLYTTRLVMGINPELFQYRLAPGERFTAPEVVLSYSGEGFGRLSRNYHKLYRRNLCRGKYQLTRRPVLVNNWEATAFSFDEEKLFQIAKDASELGIEMLVLDDGWFGKRDNDKSGLGDWFVNEKKLKGGLSALCERINGLGMKFGLWFEPEMISEDSDLYRSHPDWCLHVPGRAPTRSRSQLVLDMSRPEIVDYLFERMSEILKSTNIEYVKWDMNRSLSDVWSPALPPEREGEVSHRFVLGVYDLLERLTASFPDVLFEGCSGGGGRFDAGMLYYSPQIWCSDDTDAIDRIDIQYGTSFGYPVASMGAHVSVSPNLQNGRVTPFETRATVAMSGTFGYELDPGKLTEEEKQMVKEQVKFYQDNYFLIADGDYYRLTSPLENRRFAAWQFVSPDRKKSLVNFVQLHPMSTPTFISIKLRGLAEEKLYRVNGEEKRYTGALLMYAGLPIPMEYGDYKSFRFLLEEAE